MYLRLIPKLQRNVLKPWYPFALGLAAIADHFVLVIPMDGLTIGSIFLAPKRWFRLSLGTALGSVVGGALLAYLIQIYGITILDWAIPSIQTKPLWLMTDRWVDQYGLWVLFVTALLPVPQHPAIAIEALSGAGFSEILGVLLIGRLLKYFFFGYLASHAPEKLLRFRAIRGELEDLKPTIKPGSGV